MDLRYLSFFVFVIITFGACEPQDFEDDGVLVPLTVIEDASIPAVSINNVLLHAETYGNPSDPMLVVIHGGPGADYRSLLNYKALANDSMYVVFYDQRGSGLSQRLDKSAYSKVQVYIDELDGIIDHFRKNSTQKIVLAGHSWGAMLATAYIDQNPNEISGVILSEPGGFTWDQTLDYIERSRKLKLFDELVNDLVYQDQLITGSDHNTLDYKFALTTAGNESTGDADLVPFWRYGSICSIASIELAINNPEQMDFTTNLMAYDTKVLFAYSELNPAYGLAHASLVSAALPKVELVEIKDTGHEIPQFGWTNFYPKIKTYLNEIL